MEAKKTFKELSYPFPHVGTGNKIFSLCGARQAWQERFLHSAKSSAKYATPHRHQNEIKLFKTVRMGGVANNVVFCEGRRAWF